MGIIYVCSGLFCWITLLGYCYCLCDANIDEPKKI